MHTAPLWVRITFFLGACWVLVTVLRVLGFSASEDTRWLRESDLRFFLALWGIGMIVLYPARAIWQALQKNDER